MRKFCEENLDTGQCGVLICADSPLQDTHFNDRLDKEHFVNRAEEIRLQTRGTRSRTRGTDNGNRFINLESIDRKITSCSASGSHRISEKFLSFPSHGDVTRQHGGFGRIEPFSIECHKTKTKPITHQLDSVLSQSQIVVKPKLTLSKSISLGDFSRHSVEQRFLVELWV